MSYLLKLRGKVTVAGDSGAHEGTALCVIRSEREIEVQFDFEAGPYHWAGLLNRAGDFFCTDELPTLTPDTVSPMSEMRSTSASGCFTASGRRKAWTTSSMPIWKPYSRRP
jgi:hypothetical protein